MFKGWFPRRTQSSDDGSNGQNQRVYANPSANSSRANVGAQSYQTYNRVQQRPRPAPSHSQPGTPGPNYAQLNQTSFNQQQGGIGGNMSGIGPGANGNYPGRIQASYQQQHSGMQTPPRSRTTSRASSLSNNPDPNAFHLGFLPPDGHGHGQMQDQTTYQPKPGMSNASPVIPSGRQLPTPLGKGAAAPISAFTESPVSAVPKSAGMDARAAISTLLNLTKADMDRVVHDTLNPGEPNAMVLPEGISEEGPKLGILALVNLLGAILQLLRNKDPEAVRDYLDANSEFADICFSLRSIKNLLSVAGADPNSAQGQLKANIEDAISHQRMRHVRHKITNRAIPQPEDSKIGAPTSLDGIDARNYTNQSVLGTSLNFARFTPDRSYTQPAPQVPTDISGASGGLGSGGFGFGGPRAPRMNPMANRAHLRNTARA